MDEWAPTRRGLIAAGGFAALGLSGALEALARAAETLPAPALSPHDPIVKATMAAFADTIVPGPAGGADAKPGALEAGALEEIYEPFYGAVDAFPLIHDDLALATPRVLGRSAAFSLDLPYPDRERVLADRMASYADRGESPFYVIYVGIGTLVYLTYYGTARSPLGTRYIGFPARSDGYPNHSYGVRFKGMTRNGNPL